MTARIYPSENAIAVAIVTVCRVANEAPDKLFEEHPEGVLAGEYGSRARHYAFAALVDLFPDCPSHRISVWCGFKSNNYGTISALRTVKRSKWWSEETLAAVKAALGCPAPATEKAPCAPTSNFPEKSESSPATHGAPKMSRVEAGAAPSWSDEEKTLLRRLWPDVSISSEEVCRQIGHSLSAVKTKAKELEIRRPRTGGYPGAVQPAATTIISSDTNAVEKIIAPQNPAPDDAEKRDIAADECLRKAVEISFNALAKPTEVTPAPAPIFKPPPMRLAQSFHDPELQTALGPTRAPTRRALTKQERLSQAVLLGEPPAGRSALDQRNGSGKR